MRNSFTIAKKTLTAHKIVSVIVIVLVALGGYKLWTNSVSGNGETRYVLGKVTRGTVVASVSGTGQIAASAQIDLKTKAGGDIVYLPVAAGAMVPAGATLLSIDARDAEKSLRDAQVNLESAKLALAKLKKPPEELSLTQATNAIEKASDSKRSAENDLAKAYDDAVTAIANGFLDLPTIITGLHTILYTSTGGFASSGEWNIETYTAAAQKYDEKARQFHDDAEAKYKIAQDSYDKTYADYKGVSRFSSTATVEDIVSETSLLSKQMAEAVKSTSNLIQFYKDRLKDHNIQAATIADTHLALLADYTGKMNTRLSALLAVQSALKNAKDAIANAKRTIDENTQSLTKLKAGADDLDLQVAELTIRQRENALADAREHLADYTVRAPFAGTVAKVMVKKADTVGSGATVATFITAQELAEISLNEVDAAHVKVGEKATLTFDAIPDITLTGTVSELDAVGTMSQGVVTYTAKIRFDAQDVRVKPGMSVSASIVSAVKQDVLTVPGSAIKTQGGNHYVELLDNEVRSATGTKGVLSGTPPKRQTVEIGLSSDLATEIISGLHEADIIVVRSITPTKAATAPQAPSLFGNIGGGNRGGGAGRIQGR